ncbi:hypothetical protein Tco_0870933 [Tanacetum coccineum]
MEVLGGAVADLGYKGGDVALIWTKGKLKQVGKIIRRHVGESWSWETKDQDPKEPSRSRYSLWPRPFLPSLSSPRKFTSTFGAIRGGSEERGNGNPWGTYQTSPTPQKTPPPSLAFIKENIDVLRTMIKEHDQQAKIKAMPRRLAYADW